MKIKTYIYPFAAAILSGMAVTSCVSDNPESPLPIGDGTVGITISAAPLGSSTRGFNPGELTEDQAQPNELIQNWLVLIVQGNTIVKIIEGQPGGFIEGRPQSVWNDQIREELAPGTYSFIAFANMDNKELKEIYKEMTINWDELDNQTFNEALMYEGLIPMSGYLKGVTVQNTINETFSIEVVRLLSKVQFAFKNESASTITINKIDFQPVYDDDIYLFPDYTAYESFGRPIPDTTNPLIPPRFPKNTNPKYLTKSLFLNLSIDNGKIDRSTTYIKESIAEGNHPTDHFHIGITLKRGDQTEEIATYALADDNLKFFYRNDYVLFPIVISDYRPMLNVYDYPPIGGYPVQVENKGTEFYATFSSSGAFDIDARLIDSTGKELTVDDTPGADKTYYVQCDYDKEIYKGLNLTYDSTTRRWNGYFEMGAENKVNEPIVITFTFTIDNLEYTRTLYLRSK